MRIGYLVQQFPPEVTAGPARVLEMGKRWRDAGADVTVITAMPNRPVGRIHPDYRGRLFMSEEWEGLDVLRSWLYASPKHGFARTVVNNLTFLATSAVSGVLRAPRLDVLIASSPPFFTHLSGAMIHALRRPPLVLELRDLWPDYLVGMGVIREGAASRGLFALERRLLTRAAHNVVVTHSFRDRVIAKGADPDRVTVIPNGAETETYYASRDEAPPFDALKRRGGELVVGYLGNFGAGQALTAILDAAALLRDRTDIRFVLAGDGTARAEIDARFRELELPNLSIHPAIPREQTRAFYNACDLFLIPLAPFPILRETVPSKLFEVMACEVPVLASVAGEAARIVEESGGGWVVPPGDSRAIADAVARFRDTTAEERAETGRRARRYVAANYSRDVLAQRYLEVLERTAAGRGGRRVEAARRAA